MSKGIFSSTVIGQSIHHAANDMQLEEELYGRFSREEIRSNIASLYRAKLRAERAFKEDPIATLAEEMSEDIEDYACLHKPLIIQTDFIYDNRTDFAKELKFAPNNYNCGRQFDIGKLLNLVRKYSKLKPYTIGSDSRDLAEQLNQATFNGKDTSNDKKPQKNDTTSALSKDTSDKLNTSSTAAPRSKGAWWLGINQFNLPQENKAKKIPLKNETNANPISTNLELHNANKSKNTLSTKSFLKQIVPLEKKKPVNQAQSQKLFKSITIKQNGKENKKELPILTPLTLPKVAQIPKTDHMTKVNDALSNTKNQLKNQNKNSIQNNQHDLLNKVHMGKNSKYTLSILNESNVNNEQNSVNVPTMHKTITSPVLKLPIHH